MLTQTAAGRTFDFSHVVGGRFIPNCVALAVGPENLVYVLSRQSETIANVPWNKTGTNARVGKCTIGTVAGDEEFVGEFSKYGNGDGELIWPAGLATDSQGKIYIVDEWMNRVSIFDGEGAFLKLWGAEGCGDGELFRPSGIAIDQQDTVYIADGGNQRVQKFTTDGNYLAKWGSRGSGEGEFQMPWGLTTDHEGYVYVADYKNHRAQKFTPDGEFVSSFGSHGEGRGQLNRPSDVAVDPDGDVYVCDWGNNRVQVFAADGTFLLSLIGDAQVPAMWHQWTIDANLDVYKARRRLDTTEPEWTFMYPTGVEFDPRKQRVLVAEPHRGRLQIYNKLSSYLEPQFNL
jgi:DNA-binding beta-propeller fold protein YncE